MLRGTALVTKVLYVEHDDDNLYMLKRRFERCGDFEVLAAEDSEQGCKLAVTEHPDVILMDLEMPVMDITDDDVNKALKEMTERAVGRPEDLAYERLIDDRDSGSALIVVRRERATGEK